MTTLLTIPSKIVEAVVTHALVTNDALVKFASNDLASDRQWAFKEGF